MATFSFNLSCNVFARRFNSIVASCRNVAESWTPDCFMQHVADTCNAICTTVFLICHATMLQDKLKENVAPVPYYFTFSCRCCFENCLTFLQLKACLFWFLTGRNLLSFKSSFCPSRLQNCEASFYIKLVEFPPATLKQSIISFLQAEQLLILPLQLQAHCAWSFHLNQVTTLTSSLTSCQPGLDPNTGDFIPSSLKVLRKITV